LKEKKAASAKKARKVSESIAKKQDKLKKAKSEQKAAISKKTTKTLSSRKEKQKAKPAKNVSKLEEKAKHPETVLKDSMPLSIDFNSKDAIAYLRQLPTIMEVEAFVKGDTRITVNQATTSRLNALRIKTE